ncbi:MarR family winged helix-turn-helix transcriptional regulator [Saccharomonospora xinjiangensis]|uniref:MarR family winged helix-turn-helix transcriptional regulator n=1 Tax=Saccharomonospora xinjiangensis TaxID=75294 RepID=UPI00350F63D0
MSPTGTRDELITQIMGTLARRHSTATVLLHHAVAERLGLGPTDHKCLDLVAERGPMTGSELAGITGLTSGAITGVVARLERAGFLSREPDPHDGRKQLLHCTPEGRQRIGEVFAEFADASTLLSGFDDHQLTAIAEFLGRGIEFSFGQAALLRAHAMTRLKRRRT